MCAKPEAGTAVCTRESVCAQRPHQSSDCQEVSVYHASEEDLEEFSYLRKQHCSDVTVLWEERFYILKIKTMIECGYLGPRNNSRSTDRTTCLAPPSSFCDHRWLVLFPHTRDKNPTLFRVRSFCI